MDHYFGTYIRAEVQYLSTLPYGVNDCKLHLTQIMITSKLRKKSLSLSTVKKNIRKSAIGALGKRFAEDLSFKACEGSGPQEGLRRLQDPLRSTS